MKVHLVFNRKHIVNILSVIALLNILKDLPGNSVNTSFLDWKPTAELFSGWRLSDWTKHLSVKP